MSNLPPATPPALLLQQQAATQQTAAQQAAALEAAAAEKQKIFDVFFNQSRGHAMDLGLGYRLPSVTYCVAVVEVHMPGAVRKVLIAENVPANPALGVAESHAEKEMIKKLNEELKLVPTSAVCVTVVLYINYSPCYACANELAAFLAWHSKVSVHVIAATAWYTKRPSCTDNGCTWNHPSRPGGWPRFNQDQRLTLKAFTANTWMEFGECLNMSGDCSVVCDFTPWLVTYNGVANDNDPLNNNIWFKRSRAHEDECMAYDISKLSPVNVLAAPVN